MFIEKQGFQLGNLLIILLVNKHKDNTVFIKTVDF